MFVTEYFGSVISAIPRGYLPHVVFALLLAICGPVFYSRKKQRYVPGVPIFGIEESRGINQARKNFCTDAKTMLTEGYQKACLLSIPCRRILALSKEQYKNQGPFYLPSRLGERLMIPAKYVEELKSAPIQKVDFVGAFFEVGDL